MYWILLSVLAVVALVRAVQCHKVRKQARVTAGLWDGLVGMWVPKSGGYALDFDGTQFTASILPDKSGNGNHGIIYSGVRT